jgi:hypothetical protein
MSNTFTIDVVSSFAKAAFQTWALQQNVMYVALYCCLLYRIGLGDCVGQSAVAISV